MSIVNIEKLYYKSEVHLLRIKCIFL